MSSAGAAVALTDDKRPKVEALLGDVFRLMDYPARLEFRDQSDGSLGVAVHVEGELPGFTSGKRSYLLDCVQFWVNKVVNRPNTPRRWVNLGLNGFPEPRHERAPAERAPGESTPAAAPLTTGTPATATPATATPATGSTSVAAKPSTETKAKPAPDSKPAPESRRADGARAPRETDERTLTPADDPAMAAVGLSLAKKSAALGRLYAVVGLSAEQRAVMLKAAQGLKGVTAKAEGEGHFRRVVMVPEKLAVIPKRQVMPDYDDEEDE